MLGLLVGCAAEPKEIASPPAEFGPATMSRVDGGFELVNRKLRLVIDEKTGDVVYLGSKATNLLDTLGIGAVALDRPIAQPSGYVEKRDDQTWQFLGDSASGIGWRKIYCLEHGRVLVTYLIENKTNQPISTAIAVRAKFKNASAIVHQPDLYLASVAGATVRMTAFNEFKYDKPGVADTLVGDRRTLQPGERISLTMEWKAEGL